jgi:hypothetical protein
MVAFLLSTFSRSLVLVDYYTNPTAFVKNCQNKARPKMHCNGKCQVMKKLQDEEKKDKQDTGRRDSEDLICYRSCLPKLAFPSVTIDVFHQLLDDNETADRSMPCFQPPEA